MQGKSIKNGTRGNRTVKYIYHAKTPSTTSTKTRIADEGTGFVAKS